MPSRHIGCVESDVCIRIARFMNAWQLDLEAERE